MASRKVSVGEVIKNITQLTADELEKVYQTIGFFLMDSRLKAKQLRIRGGKILEDLVVFSIEKGGLRILLKYIREKRSNSDKMIKIVDKALQCVPESFITHDFRDDERRKPGVFEHIVATGIKKLAKEQGMIYLPEQSAGPGPDIFVICPSMAAVFVFGVKGAYVRYSMSKEYSGKGYVSAAKQRQNDYLLEHHNFFSTQKKKKKIVKQENVESIGEETAGNGSGVASALPDLPPWPMLFEDELGESFRDYTDEKGDSESEDGGEHSESEDEQEDSETEDGREDSESEDEREDSESKAERVDPESEDLLGESQFKDWQGAREYVHKTPRRAGVHAEKGREGKTEADKNCWSPKQDDESKRKRIAMAKAFSDLKLKYYFAFNVIIPAYINKRKTDKQVVDANRVGEETEIQYTATTRDDKTILDLYYLYIKSDITQNNYDTCGLFSADVADAIRKSLEEKEMSKLATLSSHEHPGIRRIEMYCIEAHELLF